MSIVPESIKNLLKSSAIAKNALSNISLSLGLSGVLFSIFLKVSHCQLAKIFSTSFKERTLSLFVSNCSNHKTSRFDIFFREIIKFLNCLKIVLLVFHQDFHFLFQVVLVVLVVVILLWHFLGFLVLKYLVLTLKQSLKIIILTQCMIL